MKPPINGETFLPSLLRDWLIAIRADLGLPAGLSIAAGPHAHGFELPLLEFACPGFTLPSHDIIGEYTIHMMHMSLHDGQISGQESAAQSIDRKQADIVAENKTVALCRAAMALKKGQQLGDTLQIPSFFDWCDARTPGGDEDGWQIQSTQIVGQGGGMELDKDKRIRRRTTSYTIRMITNEFTN